ncbi:MAG: S9 family peptidase [Dehalococcoidia bacterium]
MTSEHALTLERAVHYPFPGMNAPASVHFSPDGRLITYLYSSDETLVRELWAFEIESGASRVLVRAAGHGDTDATVSHEEALRRERQRIRGFGITLYAWADSAPILLVPLQGQLYLAAGESYNLRLLKTDGEAIDPKLSPAGDMVAYVQDGELWVLPTAPGSVAQKLTTDASEPGPYGDRTLTNGLAEFVAQEEMGRSSGYWWSPDGGRLAFVQVDVSAIPLFPIVHQGDAELSTEAHHYPFAGAANARIRLGVVSRDGGEVRWMPLDTEEDGYLARVAWTPDGQLLVQTQSRDQRRLNVVRIDTERATCETLWRDEAATWINLHDDLRFVVLEESHPGAYQILWSSERTGYRHLYLYNRHGEQIRQLTDGDWPVDNVIGCDGSSVYFHAGAETPLERNVYRVKLSGGSIKRLTPEPGMHQAVLSPSGNRLADLWDSVNSPPSLVLRSNDGSEVRSVLVNQDPEADALGLVLPEFVQLKAAGGTRLHGALYYCSAAPQAARRAVIVSVYGGPYAQTVSNSWAVRVDLRAQYLARQGYIVFKLDNRGSTRRGHAFEAAIQGNMGDLEVQDQVAGVHFLATWQGKNATTADISRVGIYGWSYGGYMTLMALLRAPDVFRAGVAGAPVTDWAGYDTHYTERDMGDPRDRAGAYEASSVLSHIQKLSGALLLIHGLIDENVHFRHTARLVNALITARKRFELLPFPNERHMPRGEPDRLYMEERLIEHFRRHLAADG